jgi:hypothetical protein
MFDYLPSSFLYRAALVPLVLVGFVTTLVIFLFIVASVKAHTEHSRVPADLPWVGHNNERFFGSLKANWRGLWSSIALYLEGYGKVCSENHPRCTATSHLSSLSVL